MSTIEKMMQNGLKQRATNQFNPPQKIQFD